MRPAKERLRARRARPRSAASLPGRFEMRAVEDEVDFVALAAQQLDAAEQRVLAFREEFLLFGQLLGARGYEQFAGRRLQG